MEKIKCINLHLKNKQINHQPPQNARNGEKLFLEKYKNFFKLGAKKLDFKTFFQREFFLEKI